MDGGEKGVSETLSYVFILSFVAVVIVFSAIQANTIINNTKISAMSVGLEESFKRIEHLIYSVAFGDAPSQILNLKLEGGTLQVDESSPQIVVALVNESNSAIGDCGQMIRGCVELTTGDFYVSQTCSGNYYPACIFNVTAGSLKYTFQNLVISVEAGGVFSRYRDQPTYSKLVFEPRMIINTTSRASKVLVIAIPKLSGTVSVGGSGTYKMIIEEGEEKFFVYDVDWATFDTLHIFVRHTDYITAWCKVFSKSKLLGEDFETNFTNPVYCGGEPTCNCTSFTPHAVKKSSGEKFRIIGISKAVEVRDLG